MNNNRALRSLLVEYNNLTRADASAIYCQGKTAIQAAVNGPKDLSSNKQDIEQALIECYLKRRILNKDDNTSKNLEFFIINTIESIIRVSKYPRTVINIILQELQSDGPTLAPFINAAYCALLESGIALQTIAAAVNIGVNNTGELIVDPNTKQMENCCSVITLVFDNRGMKLLSITNEGPFSINLLENIVELGREAAFKITEFYEESVKKRLGIK